MKNRWISRLILVICIMFSSILNLNADGLFFSSAGTATSGDQQAIIVKHGNEITTTFTARYSGDGTSFLWVWPVPDGRGAQVIDVSSESAMEAFATLEWHTAPYVPVPGETKAREETPLVSEETMADAVLGEPGIFDPEQDGPLSAWLLSRGYEVSPSGQTALDRYAEEGWGFVVTEVSPSEDRLCQNEYLPPISMRYSGGEPVLPLQLPAENEADSVKVTLYVIAESTVSTSNVPATGLRLEEPLGREEPHGFLRSAIGRGTGSTGRGVVILWKGAYPDPPELGRILGDLQVGPPPAPTIYYLTRLDTITSPATDFDLRLAVDPVPRTFELLGLNVHPPEAGRGTPRPASRLPPIASIAEGQGPPNDSPFVLVAQDQSVWWWQAPREGINERWSPVQVEGLDDVAYATSGGMHTVALRRSGTVWAWGDNSRAQLGDGTTVDRLSPAPVSGLAHVVAVATGGCHTLALKADGSVWAWGWNPYGQLGDGTDTNRLTPIRVPGLSDVVAIGAGGGYSLAATSDGTLWAWGCTRYVRDVDRRSVDCAAPYIVDGITDVIAVSQQGTLVVRGDGTVWALTDPSRHEDDGREHRLIPEWIQGISGVVAIEGEVESGTALKADGTVWGWGPNASGQLGDETWTGSTAPIQIHRLSDVVAIATCGARRLALKADGSVWWWGIYW